MACGPCNGNSVQSNKSVNRQNAFLGCNRDSGWSHHRRRNDDAVEPNGIIFADDWRLICDRN